MRKRHLPLAIQIMILCLSLVLVISSAITAIFYFNIYRITEDNIKDKAMVTMQLLNSNLDGALMPFYDMIQTGAAEFNALLPQKVARDVFVKIKDSYPDVLDFYYGSVISMYAPGGVWVSGDQWYPDTDSGWDYTWDPPKRLWHQAAMANPDKIMLVDPYVDAQTKKLVVTFSKTVKNDAGAITGVIAVDVTLDKFSAIVSSGKVTPDGSSFLIDKDGLFVVHPDQSYVLQKNIFDEMPSIDKQTVLSTKGNVIFQGGRYLCSTPVEETGWILVSTGSLDSLLAGVRRLFFMVIMIALG
ncbi:MAG: Cache 3/Cache 2 fusion domain-containing protein, partial [Treponema sp.]|nr:Cache 3/Cache 2 fusion domain-containing protein [Treponema sp.]